MKKIFLASFFLITIASAQNKISPQFSEMMGMEDSSGVTHLFYRLYSYEQGGVSYVSDNSLYHFIPSTQIDTFFIKDYSYFYPMMGGSSFTLKGYKFWNRNPSKYIYCGVGSSFFNTEKISPQALVGRYDYYPIIIPSFDVDGIYISPYNDSLVYVNTMQAIMKSSDGGWNWSPTSVTNYNFVSFAPYDSNTIFLTDNLGRIYKSSDNATTVSLVDTNSTDVTMAFEFDNNANYIYRTTKRGGFYHLIVSDNKGNQFSWDVKYSSDEPIYFSIDKLQSGKIILATGRKIFVSTDYGSTFTLLKILPRKLIGVHQKGGSNIVYTATKFAIYKIENGTLTTIKNLPLPIEAASLLPLKIGNKWVFDNLYLHENCYWIMGHSVISRKIIGETILNGKKYFEFDDYVLGFSKYLRIDSLTGYVWETDNGSQEYFITDLLAEPGEFIYGTTLEIPMGRCDSTTMIILGDTSFSVKHYSFYMTPSMSLGKGIGIVEQSFCEFGGYRWELKGAVIDGVVHGDTTLVAVKDENKFPLEFSLSQNYPNPFNPSTKIKFTIPSLSLWERVSEGRVRVTLKVFDILGREVATLVNEEKSAGEYEVEFPGVETKHASSLPSGVYFYELHVNQFRQKRKMLLIK